MVPTESPALPTAEPMEPPTPLFARRALVERDRVEPEARFAPDERRALDDERGLRVGALRADLLVRADDVLRRAGELLLRVGALPLLLPRAVPAGRPLRRDVPTDRPRGRVFAWAMVTYLPRFAPICNPLPGVWTSYPASPV